MANLFARLPLTMNLLALVLVGEQTTGSLANGALLAGIATGTSGLTAQWRGRQLDRRDLRIGMRQDLLLTLVCVAALIAGVVMGAPLWALALLVAAQGVASAAVLGGFRTLLVLCVPPEDIEPANAIDAVFVEVAFVAGPAIAGILALFVGPTGVLALMAGAFVVAAVMMRQMPTRPPAERGVLIGPAPLRTTGASAVYALVLLMGLPLGAWEASIPARLEVFGLEPAAAGPLLALTALGSGLAGLVAANLRDPLRQGRLFAGALMLAFGALFLPTAAAPNLWLLGLSLFAFGLPIAPLNALAGLTFQRTIAAPRRGEGFSLYPAMILIGAGAGQLLAGLLLPHLGADGVITLLGGIPVAGGLVVLSAAARRRRLGLAPGVGFGHDPTVADPDAY